MKRFQFSLENAMHLRRLRADMERAKLESLHTELRRLEVRKTDMDTEVSAAHRGVKNEHTVRAQQLYSLDQFSRHMSTQSEILNHTRVDLLAQVARQQVKLIEAERDFELLEKLKTKKREEWQTAFNREQEELASEVYLANWERR